MDREFAVIGGVLAGLGWALVWLRWDLTGLGGLSGLGEVGGSVIVEPVDHGVILYRSISGGAEETPVGGMDISAEGIVGVGGI